MMLYFQESTTHCEDGKITSKALGIFFWRALEFSIDFFLGIKNVPRFPEEKQQ